MTSNPPVRHFKNSGHGNGACREAVLHPSLVDGIYLLASGIGKSPMSMTRSPLLNPLYIMDGQISLEYIEAGAESALKKATPDGKADSGTVPLIEQLSAFGQVLVGVQYSACAAAHEATGMPVVMVTDPRNEQSVVQRLRKLLPSNVPVAVLVDDNDGDDHTPDITGDDGQKLICNDSDPKARKLEVDEWDQLERISVMIERIVQRLEEFNTGSTHCDHRREAKE